MQNKFDDKTLEQVKQLAQSPAGKQLLALLRQSNANVLDKAVSQASSGDFSKVSQTLAPLLASDEIKKLLKQLGG